MADEDGYAEIVLTANGLAFVAGQGAFAANGALVGPGDFAAQARQAFRNVLGLLAAHGYSGSEIVKTTVYLTAAADYAEFKAVRREFLSPPYPASSAVAVAELLLPGMLIEIDAIAAH